MLPPSAPSFLPPTLLIVGLCLIACSGDNSEPAHGASGSDGSGGTIGGGGESADSGVGGQGGDSGTGGQDAGSSATNLGAPYRYGVNFGYVPGLSDPQMASLARSAGANSARLSLPERHLDTWGLEIETGDMADYEALGFRNNVVFLSAPTSPHSTAPAGLQDWEADQYIPKNLHEPIFLPDASVNPDNYWAAYVEKTVRTYKKWIKVWSVWNEPDYVSDWQIPGTWDQSPPTSEQLIRFHGTIFDYVRMLRITSEVAKRVDPDAKVAVGGIGYPSFLSAILRYSDRPQDGSIDSEHPKTGGAYFDIIDMHYYPIFSPGNSDTGVDGLLALQKEFAKVLSEGGAGERPIVVTESGAPHLANSGPGGTEYARGYLLKAHALGQAAGLMGLDWFILGDGENPSSGPFESMGLYSNLHGLTNLDQAQKTETGIAYATLGKLLDGARFDPQEQEALELPNNIRGCAYRLSDSVQAPRAWVLWARAEGAEESASGAWQLPTSTAVTQYEWNWSAEAGASKVLQSQGGSVKVDLLGTPRVFVETEE